jgi:hypothetical protein
VEPIIEKDALPSDSVEHPPAVGESLEQALDRQSSLLRAIGPQETCGKDEIERE